MPSAMEMESLAFDMWYSYPRTLSIVVVSASKRECIMWTICVCVIKLFAVKDEEESSNPSSIAFMDKKQGTDKVLIVKNP